MIINTEVYGEVSYKDEDVIRFEEGLFGFEDEKAFILMDIEETTYKLLQSTKTEELYFVVMTPFAFHESYDFEVPDAIMEQLDIKALDHLDVLSLVVFKDPIQESTMNLKAPILMNNKTKKAKQLILNEDFPMRFEFLKVEE